ncbi:MAG TPA: VTT domain-containing protein [Candidatus Saccharimonadales bacterium]
MIPGFDFTNFASTAGPWLVMAVVTTIIFAESGLLIGFFLPGDTILFSSGFLISVGLLKFDIHLFVLFVFLAAVLGDGVGYLFGKRVGRRLFNRPNSLLFKQENIQKAEAFYEKHGGVTVILARFIPIIRTFVPIVAGVGKMTYRTFALYNVIGALLWAAGVTYAGFYIGEFFNRLGIGIDAVLLPIVALILLLSILPPAIHVLKDKRQRELIWNGTKKQLRVLFRKK